MHLPKERLNISSCMYCTVCLWLLYILCTDFTHEQLSMSVLKEPTIVSSSVLTLAHPLSVLVTMAIIWMLMEQLVMVRKQLRCSFQASCAVMCIYRW